MNSFVSPSTFKGRLFGVKAGFRVNGVRSAGASMRRT